MKRKEKYLVVFSIIYFSLFVMKKSGIYFPVINDYFSDLICIPLSLLFIEWFSKKMSSKEIQIGFWHVFIAVFYFSFVFEFWMPSVSAKFTADILDVACYFFGGIFYLIFFRTEKRSTLAF